MLDGLLLQVKEQLVLNIERREQARVNFEQLQGAIFALEQLIILMEAQCVTMDSQEPDESQDGENNGDKPQEKDDLNEER